MAISKKRVSDSLPPPHSPPHHLHRHVDVDVAEEEEAVAEQKLDPEEHSPTLTIPPDININNDAAAAAAATTTTSPLNLNPMERRKKRKLSDKERHRLTSLKQADSSSPTAPSTTNPPPPASSSPHALDLNLFSQLSSPVASVRDSAVESLVTTLRLIQLDFQGQGQRQGQAKERGVVVDVDRGSRLLEAHKDDGLQNCADNVRYSVRRLIRGVSSSRAFARQGFTLALTLTVGTVPSFHIDALMKLIVDLIEVSSSVKGQEARDCLLGRLFAYGALARSGRIVEDWTSRGDSCCLKYFVDAVLSLGHRKRYLREPAVAIILDLIEKLPTEAVEHHVLQAPQVSEWFENAIESGDTEALLLALKIQEKICADNEILKKLLPHPFGPGILFRADTLSSLLPCFKESTFCQPRVHSLWPTLIGLLLPDSVVQRENAPLGVSSSVKKHKKSRKSNSSEEEISRNLSCFCEVVFEGCFLQSSHDRKHLAFEVVLLLLPRLAVSCIPIVFSQKFVQCLVDILSTHESWLYKAAQHFLSQLSKWIDIADDRRVAIIVALQKYSHGKFDSLTHGHMVKNLTVGFQTGSGCSAFIQTVMNLFVDEGHAVDEPSDQSQTTDENSETGSPKEKDFTVPSGNPDALKMWIVESLPRLMKLPKLDLEAKSRAQKEIMKFLAVQGLFSASLGTEVTSFELHEKFKWPKVASSSVLCRLCIEQLQSLLAEAQKGDWARNNPNGFESNDLGMYFMHFLGTLCNIPSVSLFRRLNREDEVAFKKLQDMEARLSREENIGPGAFANKLQAFRYLLIQLLLQVLLHPGEFCEAATELVLCCKKIFPIPSLLDPPMDENESNESANLEMIDVLVDTLLSLLPQCSAPVCSAVEQVFRFFCDEITDAGLSRMLHVIRKDLGRHQNTGNSEGDDEDDDLLGIEEADETGEDEEVVDSMDSDDHAEDSEKILEGIEAHKNSIGVSDESDSGMDDDAMFRMDSYLTQIFKERKNSVGSDTAHSQLVLFKLRVLSLLEIYLHRNPGKPKVMKIFSCLVQAFINSHSGVGGDQLGQRILGILQKKILKAKEYPKGEGVPFSIIEPLLKKSLRAASRSNHKNVTTIAQNSTFWLLKILHVRNLPDLDLQKVIELFKQALVDYFDCKKSRLKMQFIKEAFRRHTWVGKQVFGFLLKKCENAKWEYRRVEALHLIDTIIKSHFTESSSESRKFIRVAMPMLGDLIGALLTKLPEKHSRRKEVQKFCLRTLQNISALSMSSSFVKGLKPEAYEACQCHLGDAFYKFQKSDSG